MLLIGSRFSSWFPDVDDGAAPAARRLDLNPHPPRLSRGQPAEPAELSVLFRPTRPAHVHIIFTRDARLAFSTLLYALLPSCPTRANESSQSIPLVFQPFTFLFFPLRDSTRARVVLVLFSFFLALPGYPSQRGWFLGICLLSSVTRDALVRVFVSPRVLPSSRRRLRIDEHLPESSQAQWTTTWNLKESACGLGKFGACSTSSLLEA